MKPIELNGFLEVNGNMEPFAARIFEPIADTDGGDYSCSVRAPLLFKQDKKIFGADALQARELAVQFLKSMLAGKRLTDKSGKPIDLDRLK